MICSSRFLKRLSCSTFLIATSFPVCCTVAWYTTPNEPFPMIRSLRKVHADAPSARVEPEEDSPGGGGGGA